MKKQLFLVKDLGEKKAGTLIKMNLTYKLANVRLLDLENYLNYKRELNYISWGGLADFSLVYMAIPKTGYWFLVLDLIGIDFNKISAKIEVIE